MTSDISIIIPTLNEEENIDKLAKGLSSTDCQVIVVDGGSSDKTCEKIIYYGYTLVKSKPGRAFQLNLGANEARGDILLFLHADSELPANFQGAIRTLLQKEECILGAFSLGIQNPTLPMRFIAAMANFRSNFLHLPYGDQAFFLRKNDFFSLGKFPEIPIMEDYVFVKTAGRKGKVRTLPQKVYTSARRWQRLGVLKTTIINQLVVAGYHLGISPERLRSLYRR